MREAALRKILVVDDDQSVCDAIRQAVLRQDFQVDTAYSSIEALEKDKQVSYDLIIADLMMPGMNGLELVKSLKARRPEVHVIIVTGYPTIETAVESVKVGAFDYIAKPFTPNEIRRMVTRVFADIESSEKKKSEAPDAQVQSGLFFKNNKTWLRQEEDKIVIVGVVDEFLTKIDRLVELQLPLEGKNIFQGETCARITDDRGNVFRLYTPLTGRIVKVNQELQSNPSLLKSDPGQKGWLFRMETTRLEEDIKNLSASH